MNSAALLSVKFQTEKITILQCHLPHLMIFFYTDYIYIYIFFQMTLLQFSLFQAPTNSFGLYGDFGLEAAQEQF